MEGDAFPVICSRIEFYLELPRTADDGVFQAKLHGAIGYCFGSARERIKDGETEVRYWEIAIKGRKRRNQVVELKSYVKGRYQRVEVAFKNPGIENRGSLRSKCPISRRNC